MYIGQTTRATGFNGRYETNGVGIERVYNYHLQQKRYNYPYNDHLLRSIEKYGFNNFEVDEIFDIAFSEEELNKLEYMYIKIYNLTNKKYGYNNKEGGNNYTKTKDTIIKQQKKNCKPLYCITYNKAFISEKQAIDYYKLSCKNIILGAIKNKRSVNINNVETKWEKIDYYTSNYNKKGVICLNDNKVFGKLDDARIYYNISRNDIINNRCKGKFKNIKDGLFFMYVNDYYDKLDNITFIKFSFIIISSYIIYLKNLMSLKIIYMGMKKQKLKRKKYF